MFEFFASANTNCTLHICVGSGQGDTVVSILIDLNDFWTYENREYAVAETPETEEVEV